MATIYNTIEKTAGVPKSGVVVKVELIWDTSVSPVAYADEVMINGAYGTTTDQDGYWEITTIVENDTITPTDSLYKITEETLSDDDVIYYISVPTAATPTYWVGDLLISPEDLPSWL